MFTDVLAVRAQYCGVLPANMFAKVCVLCALVLPAAAYFFGTRTSNSISSSSAYRTSNSIRSNSGYHQNSYSNSYSSTHSYQSSYKSYITYSKSYDPEGGYDLYPLNNVALQKKIEQYHNDFRRQVRPPASNMLYMHWNQEAARQAQKYAEVCRFVEHNSWKDRQMKNYLTCGQNLFGSQVKLDWYTAIESWFSEHVNFTYGSPHNVFPDIGHYTSMVWATSHQVGCGVAFCKGGPWKQFYNYVCHYCPSGNYDYYPYKIGTPCGDCPYDCVWGSLCTNSCPSLDTLGNCQELLVEPDICYTGTCDATCWCGDKIYKNYPWV